MAKRPKATQNKAKNVETPKVKHIDMPTMAKVEIARIGQTMDNYIAGVVAGMGIKGKWSFDFQSMKLIVEDNDDKKT